MKNLILHLCLLFSLPCFSQVRGIVIDKAENAPLIGASVKAFGRDSVQRAGVTAGADGRFAIPNDSALINYIEVSYTGYDTLNVPVAAQTDVDLGTIGLQQSSVQLSAVTVTAASRMNDATTETILLTDSLRASASSAAMMIGNLPGFKVDWITEDLTYGQNRNVPIIVNGRKVGLDYAKSLNPKRIKKLEIQRFPPGEYSNEPILLNIVLFENYVGWDVAANARLNQSLRNEHGNTESVSANATLSTQKWNAYVSASYRRLDTYEASSYIREVTGEESEVTAPIDIDKPNIHNLGNAYTMSVGADRRLAQNHWLSAQTWLEHGNMKKRDRYDMTSGLQQDNFDRYKTINSYTGIYYQGVIANRMVVTSNVLYNYYDINEHRDFMLGPQSTLSEIDGRKDYIYFNADAAYYFNDKWNATLGYNYIWRKYKSETKGRTDEFTSRENRNRVMATVGYTPYNKMSLRAGLTMLQVHNNQNGVSDNHVNWQPRVQLFWMPLDWLNFRAMYFNYVIYPNLDQLSTISWRISGNMVQVGNPDLRSCVMNKMNLFLTFFNWLTLEYMWSRSDNDISEWYELSQSGEVVRTFANCDYLHQYIGVSIDKDLGKGFHLNYVANWQPYKRWIRGSKHSGRTLYSDVTLTWAVPNTPLDLQGEYFVRHDKQPLPQGIRYGQEEVLMLGANYRLMKNRLTISANWCIPTTLISKRTYTKINIPGFRSETYGDDRVNLSRVLVSVRYAIGKGKVNKRDNDYVIDSEK